MKEITGTIDHRILLNYRIDPDVMQRQLPQEFRAKEVDGNAIGGICQVSLSNMRPKGLPPIATAHSHNAAHRIAVTSSQGEGVYVPRRDTNSWLNTFSGGRLFPGVYSKADFEVQTEDDHYVVHITDSRGKPLMIIDATVTHELPSGSVFRNVETVSQFFERGNIGWSSRSDGGFDAIELKAVEWRMEPMAIRDEFSSFFTDNSKYPKGSVEFDSAMIMRNVRHSWLSRDNLCDVCC